MTKATLLQMTNILRVEFLLLFFYLVAIRPKLGKPWRKRIAIGIAIVMGVTVAVTAYVVYEYKMANKKPQSVSSRQLPSEFATGNG